MKNLLLALPLLAACSSTPDATTPASTPPSTAPAASAPAPAAAAPVDTAEIEAAIKAGDGAKARQLAEQAITKSPKNPKVHYYAGVGAELTDDKAAAEKHYREALTLAPGFGEAASNLAALLLDSKRAPDALALLKPLAAKAPDDPLLQLNYATALAESGDAAAAAPVYERVLQKGQMPPETRLDYAGVLLKLGKKEDAAKVLRDGVGLPREGLRPADDDRTQLAAFGRALGQAGAFDDAIKALDRAIQIKSGADLLTYRALFKRSTKNLDGARADLEAAAKENPGFAPAHRYLGEVLEDMKKPADAKKAYEKAIAADPDGPQGKKARERLDALKGGK